MKRLIRIGGALVTFALAQTNFPQTNEQEPVSPFCGTEVAMGRVIGEFNDPAGTSVTIPSANGMRYLKVEAAGNDNMSAQFMTGTYRISY